MISFFRKIRKSLLNEGKTGRYIKYALGEIFLVMVGILFALQINNWNESNKARVYEVKMLKEIKKSLIYDIEYMKKLLKRIQTFDDTTQTLLKLIQLDNVDQELFNKYYKGQQQGYVLQYNKGAYEALKSTGIEKITNDKARNELVKYYEFSLPRSEKLLEYSNGQDVIEQHRNLLWESFDYEITESKYVKGKLSVKIKQYNSNDFKNQRLYRLLELKETQATDGQRRIKIIMKDSEELLQLINKELEGSHD